MELSKLDGDLEILVDYSEQPTITLRGEVDFRNMARVKEAICRLVERGSSSVNVDVRELVFMDSTGISALVDAASAATPKGGEIRLVSPSTQLVRVIERSGVSDVIRCGQPEEHPREAVCSVIQDTQDVVDFEIPSRAEMLAYIRARVAAFACSMPFTGDEVEDIKLAVGEAGSNAIRHGSDAGCLRVGVRMERRDDGIGIWISDKGCGFDPSSVCAPAYGALIEGGRGIMFMRALMDEVNFQFTSPGTRVELVKRFRTPAS